MTVMVTAVALVFGSGVTATPGRAEGAWSSRGIPLAGQALFGAATGNSSQDPLPRESQLGARLGIHRTYWRANQQENAIHRATLDLAAGRLPWVSFKAPYAHGTTTPLTWAQMASGAGDSWAADLARKLGSLHGPVWVAVHHEPEALREVENVQDWKAMQQRLAPIFRAHPNIAYTVILTGWFQFMALDPALSMEALWPGAQFVDLTGFDIYNLYGTRNAAGQQNTTFTDMNAYYAKIQAWSTSVGGATWGVAESGYTDLAASIDVNWLSRAYDDLKAAGGAAFSYWDLQSSSDPIGTFSLDHPAKLSLFAEILTRSDRFVQAGATTPPGTSGSAPVAAPSPPPVASVTVVNRRGKLFINVNPNRGTGYWRFQVQYLKKDGSTWGTYKRVYRTRGSKETRTLNFRKGTYRVVVKAKYGYGASTSAPVRLKK
jgi:hypothetical protein